jgi:hypothetical protein
MKLIDVDFKDGIKATFIDNTKQLTQIHYDVNTLSSMFGGSRSFNNK